MKIVSAQEIADLIKAKQIIGDSSRTASGVSSLKNANSEHISFVGNKKYQDQLGNTKASIVLIPTDLAHLSSENQTYIVCENVDMAFSKVILVFAPPQIPYEKNIHPSAVVDPSAKIGKNVHVGANAVIDIGAEIGDNSNICANCYIGRNVKIGSDAQLYPNVTVMDRCVLGNKVVLHPGVVIGADGFGFYPTPTGLAKIPQTGIVQIDDDVEIGANSTIDRARFGKTWIKTNVKIDDQVMIGHNAVIGESSILVAQCGVAGSAEIGRGVIIAAKAGINGHITIGDGAQIGGTSGVVKSVEPKAIMIGTPAEKQRDFMVRFTLPAKFEKLKAQLAELTQKVEELTNGTEKK